MKFDERAYNVLLGFAFLLLALTVLLSVVVGDLSPSIRESLAFVLLAGVPFLVFWFMPGSGVVRVLVFVAVFVVVDVANVFLFRLSDRMYLGVDGIWFAIMLGGGGIYWWWQENRES